MYLVLLWVSSSKPFPHVRGSGFWNHLWITLNMHNVLWLYMQVLHVIQRSWCFSSTCKLLRWNVLCLCCLYCQTEFPFSFSLVVVSENMPLWQSSLSFPSFLLSFVMLFISCRWSQVTGYNCILHDRDYSSLLCVFAHLRMCKQHICCWTASFYSPAVILHCHVCGSFCCWYCICYSWR